MYDVMAKREGDQVKVIFNDQVFAVGGAQAVIKFLNVIQTHYGSRPHFEIVDSQLEHIGGVKYRVYTLQL